MHKITTINNDWIKCRIVSEEQLRIERPLSELDKLKAENKKLKKTIEEYKQLVETLINESDEGADDINNL